MEAQVFKVAMSDPADVNGVARLFDEGAVRPEHVVCVLGKTEGNGCVNDFTRGYATLAFTRLFADRLGIAPADVGQRIALIMSGGTEGVLSPHCTLFARRHAETPPAVASPRKRLAISQTFTRDFVPEEIGRRPQALATAAAVRQAMAEATIADPADVHFVQVKCPLLTAERMREASARGQTVATDDTYASMSVSRAASALGVALALGEVSDDALRDEAIGAEWSLFSGVASTSAGIELRRNEVVVMGNSPAWSGDLVIGHAVMRDAIDAAAVRHALRAVGCCAGPQPTDEELARVINLFAKAEAAPCGAVRGRRHTMLDDSDINSTRHARAAVGAVLASVVGDPMLYVSGGAEHQGPAGGGPVAVIARCAEEASR